MESINTTAVDMARILDAADGDEEFLRQLVEVFLEDAALKLQEIERAICDADPRGLGRTAHQLKGSSANVGADGLRDYARALETIGRAESLAGANDVLQALHAEYGRVREQLLPLLAA